LVAERFSPHDTIVTVSNPKELSDTALNSVCGSHAATASVSSSNSSLRQRRLTDIAESANEEGGDAASPGRRNINPNSRKHTVQHVVLGGSGNSSGLATTDEVAVGPLAAAPNFPGEGLAVVVTSHDLAVSDERGAGAPAIQDRDPTTPSLFLSKGDYPSTNANISLSVTTPFDSGTPSLSEPRRKSTSSSLRPSASDIYSQYPYVPKVKLGPRPHVEPPKRPHTSNERERTKTFQPSAEELRAAVPRSVHIPPRRTTSSSRTPTTVTTPVNSLSIPEPQLPPSPTTPTSLRSFSIYSSSASVKTSTTDGPTPEKQRLMRALQLRRQQQIAQQKQQDRADEEEEEEELEEEEEEEDPAEEGPDDEEDDRSDDSIDPAQSTPITSTMSPIDDDTHNVADPADENRPDKIKEDDNNQAGKGVDGSTGAVPKSPIDKDGKLEGPEEPLTPERERGDGMDASKDAEEDNGDDQEKPEPTPEIDVEATEHPSPAETEDDKLEGTTKVRDDVDEESDGESIVSLETQMNESRPGAQPTTITTTTTPSTQVPAAGKSIHQAVDRKSSSDVGSMPPPKALKRVERSSTVAPEETPVVETARSVSGPFLKNARTETKPAIAKKVTVGSGGGSVSQRIKQFQQLASAKPKSTFVVPARTPSASRSNSPTPEFLANRPPSAMSNRPPSAMSNRPPSAMSNKSPPRVNSMSFDSTGPAPPFSLAPSPATVMHRQSMPPQSLLAETLRAEPVRSKLEFVEKDNRPQLQVTTKISREPNTTQPSSAFAKSPSTSLLSPTERDPSTPDILSMPPHKLVEVPPNEPALRRSSVDLTGRGRRITSEKDQRPQIFSRSPMTKDLDDVPEGGVSATVASTGSTRRGSSSSAKSPKSPSFLQRVSHSLTRKKDPSPPPASTPASAPAPPKPVESAKKTFLHAGSINVQLPDTMLWKRRYMKVDSDGWLFLSLTDDEVCLQLTHSSYLLCDS